MKNKKILTAILSVTTAATLLSTVLAGCNKKQHAYVWTTEKEATCSETGLKRGVCNLHGDVTEEIIPVDPDNHKYGEWEVDLPTETATGKATKVCEYNSSHTTEVILPTLAEKDKYLSYEETKRPTSISEGAITYVYANDIQNITFDIAIPKRGLETVEDGVYVGWANADKVRSRSGVRNDAETVADSKKTTFTYEFGDGYTHVLDSDGNKEYWYTIDENDNPFGVLKQGGKSSVVLDAVAENVLGYSYQSGGGSFVTYGAEDALYKYYETGRIARETGAAVDYKEADKLIKNGSSGYTGWFEYGFYENPTFCRYRVDFDLNADGVITNLVVETTIVRPYMIEEDASGNKLFYENGDIVFAEQYWAPNELPQGHPEYAQQSDPMYELDGNGKIIYDGYKKNEKGQTLYAKPKDLPTGAYYNVLNPVDGQEIPRPKPHIPAPYTPTGTTVPITYDSVRYYSYDHEEVSHRTVTFNAPVLKKDTDTPAQNPYSPDQCYVSSFDLAYNNKTVDDSAVTIEANKEIRLDIKNLQPTTALLDYDPIQLYVRTSDGDRLLSQNPSDNEYQTTGFCDVESRQVSLKVMYAGEVTIVLRSRGGLAEKAVKLNVKKGAPTTLLAQAYTYSDATGKEVYTWSSISQEVPCHLYLGQKIYVRAAALEEEKLYADTSVNANSAIMSGSTIIDNPYLKFEEVDFKESEEAPAEKVIQITATQAGEYGFSLVSKLASSTYVAAKIIVENAPSARDEILIGEYTAKLNYLDIDEELTFTFVRGSNWKKSTIKVTTPSGEMNFDYVYDDTTGVLTTTRKVNDGGVQGEYYDFVFAINSQYKLTVTHSTPFENDPETVVLSKVQA